MGTVYRYLTPPEKTQSRFVRLWVPSYSAADILEIRLDKLNNSINPCWRLVHLMSKLTTSAVVANRTSYLQLMAKDAAAGQEQQVLSAVSGNVAASATARMIVNGLQLLSNASLYANGSGGVIGMDLERCILQGDDYIQIGCGNVQTGDTFIVTAMMEYLNYKDGITSK